MGETRLNKINNKNRQLSTNKCAEQLVSYAAASDRNAANLQFRFMSNHAIFDAIAIGT